MILREVMSFRFDENTGRVCRDSAIRHFPNVPLDVVQQVIIDHGRNSDLQEQYGHLDFNLLTWSKENLPGAVLRQCTRSYRSDQLFANCFERTSLVAKKGWKFMDGRRAVSAHWEQYGTWLLPPVLIAGELVGRSDSLHIVEGHTRIGNLTGLIHADIISDALCHGAWVGQPSRFKAA